MPAGMETMIAMQNPNAIITNNALILRLEIFLIALVKTPNYLTLQRSTQKKVTSKKRRFREEVAFLYKIDVGDVVFMTLMAFIISISLFGCLFLV